MGHLALERNRRGTRGLLWIVLTLYPGFGILDYLTAPRAWLWLLYSTRVFITLVTLIMFKVVQSSLFDRHQYTISSAYIVLISYGISLMTVFMGGLASPYYAGLSLVIVATGLLYVWPLRVVAITHTTIVLSFVLSNVAFNEPADWLTTVSNQFFLVSTAIIAGTGQLVSYRSLREQVRNQLLIESTTKHLEQAHGELKRLDRFKSEFFANVTHELKTPLTMMLAPLELMIEGQLGSVSEAQRSTLSSIQKSGIKLRRLIGDLLDLSKLEESKLRLRIGEHDLVDYVRGLVAQAEPLAQRKSISLSFQSNTERCVVWCDLERLERVLVNLLSNATKFTQPDGRVQVTLKDQGENVLVEVCDTGIGFPPGMAERIFDRFFQVDMAGTRRYGGTGIGLALAKELVELHGGKIWARGEVGEGATLSVRLPKDREHFKPEALDRRGGRSDHPFGARSSDRGVGEWRTDDEERYRLIDIDQATEQRIVERDADEHFRPHSVLVVEDTADVIRMIRLALHHDFRVLAASDGRKGLELARKHQPTVIVTDLMMPELDGLELTRELRAGSRDAAHPDRDADRARRPRGSSGRARRRGERLPRQAVLDARARGGRALSAHPARDHRRPLDEPEARLAPDHRRRPGARDPEPAQLHPERGRQHPARLGAPGGGAHRSSREASRTRPSSTSCSRGCVACSTPRSPACAASRPPST